LTRSMQKNGTVAVLASAEDGAGKRRVGS
jgi:hypothetical protein